MACRPAASPPNLRIQTRMPPRGSYFVCMGFKSAPRKEPHQLTQMAEIRALKKKFTADGRLRFEATTYS